MLPAPSPQGMPAPPAGPPGGVGPAAAPGHMAGSAVQGSNLLKAALEMLQKALPMLPLGSDEHNATIDAVKNLSKHIGPMAGGGDPQAVIQQLAQLARQTQQAPVPGPLAGGGAGGPPPPGGGGMPAPPMAA